MKVEAARQAARDRAQHHKDAGGPLAFTTARAWDCLADPSWVVPVLWVFAEACRDARKSPVLRDAVESIAAHYVAVLAPDTTKVAQRKVRAIGLILDFHHAT